MKISTLSTEYVENLPDDLTEGILYVSELFELAAHKCCCGCGEEVITPLKKAHWTLIKSRKGVSLIPSIGNWKFRCRSHYLIRDNRVIPAGSMTAKAIERVKKNDRRDADRRILEINNSPHSSPRSMPSKESWSKRFWRKLLG